MGIRTEPAQLFPAKGVLRLLGLKCFGIARRMVGFPKSRSLSDWSEMSLNQGEILAMSIEIMVGRRSGQETGSQFQTAV
jgi:hypothetical protein